jgi:hypothetical protein
MYLLIWCKRNGGIGMNCPKCKNEITGDSKFCNKCGTKLDSVLILQNELDIETNDIIPKSDNLEGLLTLFQNYLKSDNIIKLYSPKLKHFFNYVVGLKPNAEKDVNSLRNILEREITPEFLENSVVEFIRVNANANSEQIFDNYFTSVISFFKIMNLHHIIINPEILRISSVAQEDNSSLSQIKQRAKLKLKEYEIDLKKREPDPPLEEEEVLFLIKTIDNEIEKIIKRNEKRKDNEKPIFFSKFSNLIYLKFILFSGIKYDTLVLLSYKSFDKEYKTFSPKLVGENKEDEKNYEIHLPKKLSNQISKYLEYRCEIFKSMNKNDNNYFLIDFYGEALPNLDKSNITRLLSEIKSYYINEKITDLEDEYLLEQNHFTVTGLTKYSIIEMIKKGINQSIIQDFTGNEKYIYDSCQECVNRLYQDNRSRYLDSKLRSIPLFDLL